MLSLVGRQQPKFCDGISRRNFLRIGGLAMGGMTLPEILRAEAASLPTGSTKPAGGMSHKGVIMIFLAGGPPHQDTFDLKPDAPREVRGEFNPISTNLPGVQICELLPRTAQMMDRLAVIRSLKGCTSGHDNLQCFSGYGRREKPWPSVGSFLAKIEGPADRAVPPFVGLSPDTSHAPWGNPGEPRWLGSRYAPFRPENGQGMKDMKLDGQIQLGRLKNRKGLLQSVDRFRREVDYLGQLEGTDAYTEQAFNVLTSSKLVEALDVEQADPHLRDRYGRGSRAFMADGPWRLLDQFLVARRLIEAGVRCVTLSFSRWDWHGGNFKRARQDVPMLDQGLTALVDDIHQRGLDKDISVVVWGEFGRTPKINENAGRDHWPNANFAVLAGGGMRTGQVLGATDRTASVPVDRPIHPQEVLATIYHCLGIDLNKTTVTDATGRPQYLLDYRDPIRELV